MQTENSLQAIAIVVFAVVASRLVRRGRLDPAVVYLQPRQRIRPLLLEILDPLLALIVVGPVLAHELNLDTWHVLSGLLGLSAGIPIGILRSRAQFVRALTSTKSVVLTRSRAEYMLVLLLVVLRSGEDVIRQNHTTAITLLAALLLALPIGESCARTLSILNKYQNSSSDPTTMGLS